MFSMGTICGKKNKSNELVPDPVTGLNGREVELIRDVWTIVMDKATFWENGTMFFIKLFKEYPGLQEYFSEFKGQTPATLALSTALRAHGIAVFTSLTTCIDLLEDNTTLVALIQKRASAHYYRGITIEEIEKFTDVLLDYLKVIACRNNDNSEELAAWGKFLTFHNNVYKMKFDALAKESADKLDQRRFAYNVSVVF